MRVFVTGATGVIGRRAIPLLLRAGHRVTAAVRSPDRVHVLERLGASALALDLFDADAVRLAMVGHDTVINLATHVPSGTLRQFVPGAWKEMDCIRKEGSALLADAAIAAGARRFVQESFAPIYPDCGDRWIREDTPPEPARYNRTVLFAEASAERFARSDRIGIALRFAFLYGSEDRFTNNVFRYVRHGWLPILGRPEGFYSMVNHEDAASAVVAALDAPSGIYNVVDDEPLTRHEFGDALAEMLNVRSPRLPPVWLVTFTGGLGETIARSLRISNSKLKKETDWTPQYPTARTGWLAALRARTHPEAERPARTVRS
jgi:nucleoside-diphosphate-sugar epimerase